MVRLSFEGRMVKRVSLKKEGGGREGELPTRKEVGRSVVSKW